MKGQGSNNDRQPENVFALNSDIHMACTGRSSLPPGLSRSSKNEVRFDSMKDLKKFLNNYCCVPGSALAGPPLGSAFGV